MHERLISRVWLYYASIMSSPYLVARSAVALRSLATQGFVRTDTLQMLDRIEEDICGDDSNQAEL